jgi:hypothetical protein
MVSVGLYLAIMGGGTCRDMFISSNLSTLNSSIRSACLVSTGDGLFLPYNCDCYKIVFATILDTTHVPQYIVSDP